MFKSIVVMVLVASFLVGLMADGESDTPAFKESLVNATEELCKCANDYFSTRTYPVSSDDECQVGQNWNVSTIAKGILDEIADKCVLNPQTEEE